MKVHLISFDKNTKQNIAFWLPALLVFSFALYKTGAYNFCYASFWYGFYFDKYYITDTLLRFGGMSRLLSDFTTQFFVTPFSSCLLYSIILIAISLSFYQLLKKVYGFQSVRLISLLPSLILALHSFDIHYVFSGTIALLFVFVFLNLGYKIRKSQTKHIYIIASSLFLYCCFGPVALVYCILSILFALKLHGEKTTWSIVALLLTISSAYIGTVCGRIGSFSEAFTPKAYYISQAKNLPTYWLIWISPILIAIALSFTKNSEKSRVTGRILQGACLLAVILTMSDIPSKKNERPKELSYLAYHKDWNSILKLPKKELSSNLSYHNYISMALANKGQLCKQLFSYKFQNASSIFITDSPKKNPHIYAMLSDVHYTMGHISRAQQFAFEANECYRNWSPRMLKRLVETNYAFGYTEVADKYLRLLSKNILNHKWAKNFKQTYTPLNIPENKSLIGLESSYEEIACIVDANPGHKQSLQYLFALCLVNMDRYMFMHYLERYYDVVCKTDILPADLLKFYIE